MTEEAQTTEMELEKPLDKMTVKELRELAKDMPEITGASAMKKDELLSMIKQAKGIEEEAPKPKKAKTKGPKKVRSIKELKEAIKQLQEVKAGADQAKDKKTSGILRRRLNRLKKMTRKAVPA